MPLRPIPIHGPDGGGPNADPSDPKSLSISETTGWWTEPGGQPANPPADKKD